MADAQSEAKAVVRQSRIAAFQQMAQPITAIGLVTWVGVFVIFSGWALMRDKLDSSAWGSIGAYLFGALSGGALGMAARAPQRSNDSTSTTATTTPGTNGSGSATVTAKVNP